MLLFIYNIDKQRETLFEPLMNRFINNRLSIEKIISQPKVNLSFFKEESYAYNEHKTNTH